MSGPWVAHGCLRPKPIRGLRVLAPVWLKPVEALRPGPEAPRPAPTRRMTGPWRTLRLALRELRDAAFPPEMLPP